jgi:predicted dehydrogenase
VSGLDVARLTATIGALMPGRKVADYASALLEFNDGTRGTFTATQAAVGVENDIRLRIYGARGMLDWSLRVPSYMTLALHGEAVRTIGRGDADLPAEIIALGRMPRGHPEGLREAFANLYVDVAKERMACTLGEAVPPIRYPTIAEGARTMAFIEACVASQRSGAWVEVAGLPPV